MFYIDGRCETLVTRLRETIVVTMFLAGQVSQRSYGHSGHSVWPLRSIPAAYRRINYSELLKHVTSTLAGNKCLSALLRL